jgi:hypothetical protein
LSSSRVFVEAIANVEIILQEWIKIAQKLDRLVSAPRGRLAFA